MCKVKNRKGEGYLCTRGRIDGEAKSKKKKLSSSKKERERKEEKGMRPYAPALKTHPKCTQIRLKKRLVA